ncbi:MAG: hypothetical protein ACI4PO_11400 [Faecousia sp.]
MRRNEAKAVALGGVLAALAIVIMCMGGLIPVATFVCPMMCMLMLKIVLARCGSRMGWAWYAAVAILSLLLGPDKEAAAVFLFLGYYPIIKPWLDGRKLHWLLKGLLFNCAILAMYWVLLRLLGMEELTAEFAELGTVMTVVMLVMGNITFFLLDRLLGMRFPKRKSHG